MMEFLKWANGNVLLWQLGTFAIALLVIYAAKRALIRGITTTVSDNATRYRASKAVSVVQYVLIVLIGLYLYAGKFGSLSVAFGVAGAGITFALQEVILSFAGWVAIVFGGYYKAGDRIQLGGTVGDVIDVGLIRTTLMEIGQWVNADLYTGRVVRIANSFAFKDPVYNYSGDFPFLWDEIKVPIKYGCDHRLTRKMLEDVAEQVVGAAGKDAAAAWDHMVRKFLIEAATTSPVVTLIANDNWMEFTVRYVVNYRLRRATKDHLFTAVLDGIAASGGAIAMASTTVDLVGMPRLDVKVRSEDPPVPEPDKSA
jgi:small-conductance mechanosensitive channel